MSKEKIFGYESPKNLAIIRYNPFNIYFLVWKDFFYLLSSIINVPRDIQEYLSSNVNNYVG